MLIHIITIGILLVLLRHWQTLRQSQWQLVPHLYEEALILTDTILNMSYFYRLTESRNKLLSVNNITCIHVHYTPTVDRAGYGYRQ